MPIPVWIMEFPVLDAGLVEIAAIILTVLIVLAIRSPGMIFRAFRDHIDTVSQLREMFEHAEYWKSQYDKKHQETETLTTFLHNLDDYRFETTKYAELLLESADLGFTGTPEWRQLSALIQQALDAYSCYKMENPFADLSTSDKDRLQRSYTALGDMVYRKKYPPETKKQIPA